MEQRAQAMNKGNMIGATERAIAHVQALLNRAEEIRSDARKNERVSKLECKACFYGQKIGGAAMTYRACMCCRTRVLYSSTNTDVLCVNCAGAHGLCKHCGGDLNMRARRRDWPAAPDAEVIE